jgi:hypothetical protein
MHDFWTCLFLQQRFSLLSFLVIWKYICATNGSNLRSVTKLYLTSQRNW